MALRISLLIHCVLLLLLTGCSAHRPITAGPVGPDAEMIEAKEFVGTVADKMPLWDADAIAAYERVEIATVKADIAMAQQDDERGRLLDDVAKLHDDWAALVALDELLKKESLI